MGQFDVHADRKAKHYPLLLDVQADLLSHLDTRIVVPLAPKRRYPVTPIVRLNPIFTLDGTDYVAVFQELSAISRRELGDVQASFRGYRSTILAALDLIITGA